MRLALIHTYKSGLLENNLKYHLKLAKEVIDQFVIIFCRWSSFPDMGEDNNITMVKEKFKEEIKSGRIVIIEHAGLYEHNEFECRELIINSYSDHTRIWIDSDELLGGRFWRIIHAQKNQAYKISHTIMNPESVQKFRGVPYLFGRYVKIIYTERDFMSLQCYSDFGAVDIIELSDLYNVSLQLVEDPDYIENKKKWISNFRLEK